ncbi:TPA: YSIRK-type signal peptide-containing protein, partial [Streptococcus suis]
MNRSKKKSFNWYGMRQQFSIRKYHFGAASVLLGMTLVLSAGTIVSAETGVNGDGTSNGQIVNNDGTSDGTNSPMQQQSDNQGNNSSGVQADNKTNPTANDQSAGDTGSASGQPVGTSRSANTGTQGDGSTNQPVDEPVIKFPTSESDPVPNGYVLVSFQKPEYGSYVFNNLPGEFPNATKQSINSRPIQLEVRFWVKEGTTWGQLIEDPNWRWPTMKPNDGDVFIDWNIGYGYSNRFDFNKKKDQPVTTTYFFPVVGYEVEEVEPLNANVNAFLAWYSPEGKSKWLIVTFDAGKGSMTYKNKQYTSRSVAAYFQGIGYDNRQFTSKVVSPTLDGHTFVRWQTEDGKVLPTTGTITSTEAYKALYLAHPQNKVAVFDSTKLTTSEKEQVKQNIYDANPDLSTGVAPVIKAIDIS